MVFNLSHSAKIERIYTESRAANIGSIRLLFGMIESAVLVLSMVFIVLPFFVSDGDLAIICWKGYADNIGSNQTDREHSVLIR